MLPVYKTIAVEVLAMDNNVELEVLREMLSKLVENLEMQVDPSNPIYAEFYRYLVITHLVLVKQECSKHNLTGVLAKLNSSLLRYTKEIRADKAYFDAGQACRSAGLNDSAFIFFNRYIDLYDAIDDPDNAGGIDNTEFENTDIPSPFEIPLPEKNMISP
jgi:intraflagellar transport protein 172